MAPRSNVVAFRSPRRRRWLVASSALAIVAVGGAGVAAYMGMRPSVPSADLLCRGSVAGDRSSIAIELGQDPIGQCAELWRKGDLPDVDRPTPGAEVPRLVACTGKSGSIEVLPLPELRSCSDVGLLDADTGAAFEDPVAELRRVFAYEVNTGPCRPPAEVQRMASTALAAAGLDTWTVTQAAPEAECGLVAVVPETRELIIRPKQPPLPLQQENP